MKKDDGIIGKWTYGASPSFAYGGEASYVKAMEFLDGPYIIEDWGCGTAWARKYVKRGRYIGLDGSWSMHCDQIVDLREYKSSADAILLRHVLDHNWEWRKILENALASFQKKLCLILFTPFGPETKQIATTWETVPDISFKKEEILEYLKPFQFTEETMDSHTQYRKEHLFFVTRSSE